MLIDKTQPAKEIHIVLDNLSAYKTQAVRDFLEANPNGRFHFTPTYSSWLNQVEIWFSKIERGVISRGVFTSVNYPNGAFMLKQSLGQSTSLASQKASKQ